MSGWLTKSPPEKKTQGPWKLFKAKWRKRYFVLNEVPAAQSLPGHRAALLYFDSENMKHKLGQIDLSSCDEVQQRLESSFYRHVFSLRTKHKGKDRTYYLVAESETEMNKWVDCLCCVLGLKESDCEQKRDSVNAALASQNSTNVGATLYNQRELTPTDDSRMAPVSPPRASPPQERGMDNNNDAESKGEQYIHLDECWTGNKVQELDAVPPPPAMPPRSRQVNQSNFHEQPRHSGSPRLSQHIVSSSQTYDKPRSYQSVVQNNRHEYYQSGFMEDQYDIPKSSKLGNNRDSANVVFEDTYDIPRSLMHEAPSQDSASLSSSSGTLGGARNEADDRYINLADNKSYAQTGDGAYDFPVSSHFGFSDHARDTALLNLTPPPPASHMPKSHKYVNAKAGVIPPQSASSMESNPIAPTDESIPSHSQTYDAPRAVKDPQKLLLFSNHRTRSFKRNIASNQTVIPLPMKKDGAVSEDSSSEEEDQSESNFTTKAPESHGKYMVPALCVLPPKKSLNSTPPPPPTSSLEVQYLDLDLGADKPGYKIEQVACSTQGKSKEQAPPPPSTTDYREIDFVKTKALGRMKQDVEKKRLSSEQSTDES